jgi:filamentous hemagglutinin family protein
VRLQLIKKSIIIPKYCCVLLKANMKTQSHLIINEKRILSPCNRVKNLIILALCFPPTLLANPSGSQVISGQVSIDNSVAGVTKITNSPGAIIHWQDFNIKKNEITQFIQQNSKSSVLNRIVGGNPTEILGQLISNGKVFLINPNGVVFGSGSSVDTQGLMVSTLDLSNNDFKNNTFHFIAGSNTGNIRSEGIIHAGADGNILLISPTIENTGSIKTEGGKITLAAGQEFTLTSLDNPDIQFQIQAPENNVLNIGELLTQGGAVDIFANSITHSGAINADSVGVDKQGNIQLFAKEDVTLGANSKISANNNSDKASNLHIKADNAVLVGANSSIESTQGKLNIVLNADADAKNGGNIQVNSGTTLNSHGGNIILGGGKCSATDCDQSAKGYAASLAQSDGVSISHATLNSNGGEINIYGEGYSSKTVPLSDVHGVFIDQSTLTSNAGNITINGKGGEGKSNHNNNGIFLTGNEKTTDISTTSGNITLTGTSSASNGSDNFGLSSDTTTIKTSGGSITLNGKGANGDAGLLFESNSRIGDASTGDITLASSNTAKNSNSFSMLNTIPSGKNPILQTKGTLSINASGNVSQLSPIMAEKLMLSGNANYQLTNAENTIGTLVANTIGNLNFLNSGVLALGDAQTGISSTGTIAIATNKGDLTIANAITTNNASQNALKLNAGQSEKETLDSNIIISENAKVSIGNGGVGQLLTGSIENSTGVFDLVGLNHSRYGSDETTVNYSAPLTEGIYAIYREQPTLTVVAESVRDIKILPYLDGTLYSTGFVNGDNTDILTNITFSGSSQGNIKPNVYTYDLTPNADNTLGYQMVFLNGTVTLSNDKTTPITGTEIPTVIKNTQSQQTTTVITLSGQMNTNDSTSESKKEEDVLASNDVTDATTTTPLGQCQ